MHTHAALGAAAEELPGTWLRVPQHSLLGLLCRLCRPVVECEIVFADRVRCLGVVQCVEVWMDRASASRVPVWELMNVCIANEERVSVRTMSKKTLFQSANEKITRE